MDEHTRKTIIMLIVVVAIAAIIGIVYYLTAVNSPENKEAGATSSPQGEAALDSLQSKTSGRPAVPMTPAQQKALQALGSTATTTPKQSLNPPTKEKSILDTLQGK